MQLSSVHYLLFNPSFISRKTYWKYTDLLKYCELYGGHIVNKRGMARMAFDLFFRSNSCENPKIAVHFSARNARFARRFLGRISSISGDRSFQ